MNSPYCIYYECIFIRYERIKFRSEQKIPWIKFFLNDNNNLKTGLALWSIIFFLLICFSALLLLYSCEKYFYVLSFLFTSEPSALISSGIYHKWFFFLNSIIYKSPSLIYVPIIHFKQNLRWTCKVWLYINSTYTTTVTVSLSNNTLPSLQQQQRQNSFRQSRTPSAFS